MKWHLFAKSSFLCPSGGKLSVQIQGYLHLMQVEIRDSHAALACAYKYNLVAAKINSGKAPYRGSRSQCHAITP